MIKQVKYTLLSAGILCLAAALRLPHLSDRPMHTDEAVHGMKLGEMMHGEYRYDPNEFHGPSLNFFTLPLARISGNTISSVHESTLRLVPVIFSLLTILLILNMRSALGGHAALLSGLLLAVSPVFVYYSRYYIQETLLVFFTTGLLFSAFRWIHNPSTAWSLLTGFFLGCMHATKETWILNLLAIIISLILLRTFFRVRLTGFPVRNLLWAGLAMILTSALFHSNGFTYFKGIADSWRTYSIYLTRGTGDSMHGHFWFMYFKWLFFQKLDSGFLLSEIAVFLAAVPVFIIGILKHRSLSNVSLFLLFYTVILTVIYSSLPYKTPWLLLSFWQGWIILAGLGWTRFSGSIRNKQLRTGFLTVSVVLFIHLTGQSYAASHCFETDPGSPWTYAQPQDDIDLINKTVREIAGRHPRHQHLFIQIYYPDHAYWPLPWTFRDFTNIRWADHVSQDTVSAPLIVIAPALEPQLIRKLYELPPPGRQHLYIPLFTKTTALRPGAPVNGYIQKQTWDSIYGE